jgi:hypothetical protein
MDLDENPGDASLFPGSSKSDKLCLNPPCPTPVHEKERKGCKKESNGLSTKPVIVQGRVLGF